MSGHIDTTGGLPKTASTVCGAMCAGLLERRHVNQVLWTVVNRFLQQHTRTANEAADAECEMIAMSPWRAGGCGGCSGMCAVSGR